MSLKVRKTEEIALDEIRAVPRPLPNKERTTLWTVT